MCFMWSNFCISDILKDQAKVVDIFYNMYINVIFKWVDSPFGFGYEIPYGYTYWFYPLSLLLIPSRIQ